MLYRAIEAFVSLDTLLSIPYSLPYFILLLRVSFTYRHVSVIATATAGHPLSWYYHPLRDSFLTLATAQICHAFFSSLSSVYATSSDVLSFVYASARLVLFCDVMQFHVSSFFILACFQCFFLHVCISFLIISLFVLACLQLFFLTGLPPVCVSVHIISFLISLFMTTPDMCRSVVSFLYATV